MILSSFICYSLSMNIRSTTASVIFIAFIAATLWGWNYGSWDFWAPDEPRYVQIVDELLSSNNWLMLTYNSAPYPDKPPLAFWFMALFSRVSGQMHNEWLLRLPSVLSATAILFLVFLLGRRFWNPRTGLYAALILATMPAFALEAPQAKLDMLFSLLVFIPLLIYSFSFRSSKAPHSFSLIIFWLSSGLSVLTKGPLGFILIAGTILITSCWEKDWNTIKQFKPLRGIILSVGIVLLWFIPQALTAPEQLVSNQLFKQNIVRYLNYEEHRAPVWYYIQQFLFGEAAPWGWFLPVALYILLKQSGLNLSTDKERRTARLLVVWFLFPLLFLTLSPSKRLRYLLPAFPAIALLLGWFWAEYLPSRNFRFGSIWRIIALSIGIIMLFAAATLSFFPGFREILSLHYLIFTRASILGFSLSFCAGAVLLISLARKDDNRSVFLGLFILMFTLGFCKFSFLNRAANSRYSVATLNEMIASSVADGEIVGVYKDKHSYYHPYGNYLTRDLDNTEEIKGFLAGGQKRTLVITLDKIDDKGTGIRDLLYSWGLQQINMARYHNQHFVLFQNRPNVNNDSLEHDPDSLNIVIIGDTRKGARHVEDIGNLIVNIHQQYPISAIITTGDNVTAKSNFNRDMLRDFLEPLHHVISQSIPIYASLGNHDDDYTDDEIIHPVLNMKGRRYYTKVFGDNLVEFFILDSNTIRDDEEQLEWFKESLEKSDALWKLVVIHEPMYASNVNHGGSQKLIDLIEPLFSPDNDVDIVLSAHNHLYERLNLQNGVLHITMGNTGSLSGRTLKPDPIRAVGYNDSQAFLFLQFKNDTLEFHAYSCQGKEVDAGRIKDLPSPSSLTFLPPENPDLAKFNNR